MGNLLVDSEDWSKSERKQKFPLSLPVSYTYKYIHIYIYTDVYVCIYILCTPVCTFFGCVEGEGGSGLYGDGMPLSECSKSLPRTRNSGFRFWAFMRDPTGLWSFIRATWVHI